jgi:single-strand DNA-binding protein
MSQGLNRAMLLGYLCADPVLRYTQGGTPVLNIRIATNQSFFDKGANERKERVDFHNVVVWGKLGERLAKVMKKGGRWYVEGPLRTSSYSDQQGNKRYKTEVVATLVRLCGERKADGQDPPSRGQDQGGRPSGGEEYAEDDFGGGGPNEEDIPF